MAAPAKDLKRHNCGLPKRSQKKKRCWKELFNKKKPGKRGPFGVKLQDFRILHQAKLSKLLHKRNRRQKEREIQRRLTRTVEEQIHLPTCQALNRLESPCKSKVLENTNFCKIHQFNDSTSALVQCLGTNKRLKRCIKSVPKNEQYCHYHKNNEK